GKSDLRECYSRVETIIEHLLKLAWSQHAAPKAGWRLTITRERLALELVISTSLRQKLEATLAARHERALRLAASAFKDEEPAAPRDASLRWSLPQILGEADDPIA